MSEVCDRFLSYVRIDTQSAEEAKTVPSTKGQFDLAGKLYGDLCAIGASDVRFDEKHCYVYASIPSNVSGSVPCVGFISHMDTSPAVSGKEVKPQITRNYCGGDINLSGEYSISVKEFPELLNYKGCDIITSDGTTLLGADDKAGVAEIMTLAHYLLTHPEVKHGKIRIGFTPDEEVGNGVEFFDVAGFDCDFAYTVDGGALGELEYENFNAQNIQVIINGKSIHPGDAKGKMKNALLIAMEFQKMLPEFDNPAYTEGYEGFYHLEELHGKVDMAVMSYIIRDHDAEKFGAKKALVYQIASFLNFKYGNGTVDIRETGGYNNMKKMIEPHMEIIEFAKKAMVNVGVTPRVIPVRGGTDGAKLSYMGILCPNLCTGGHNFHGRYEYIPVQSMEKTVEILIQLVLEVANSHVNNI